MNPTSKLAGNLHFYDFQQADSVWSIDAVSPCITTDGHRIGHSINVLVEDEEKESIKFLSSHGIVLAREFDSVSLTFGMSLKSPPHTPCMSGGVCKTITTMCDHDIGVVVKDE